MTELVRQFETLNAPNSQSQNPRIPELDSEIERIDQEIEKLMARVADADAILMGYINKRISELHTQATALKQERSDLQSMESQRDLDTKQLKNYMQHWDELEFDDKRTVVDLLITVIKVTETTCEITWKV